MTDAEYDKRRNRTPGAVTARSLAALRSLIFMIAALGWGLSGYAAAAIINEPMNGATAPGWVIGGSAYLTASSGVDPVGDGWLRLTDLGGNEAGYAYLNTAFDISQGAVIQFDYVTWGGAGDGGFGCQNSYPPFVGTGADGYSIFLFDGTQSFSVGGSGGSLGYANNTNTGNPGLSYGYIGTGIDEWGNFSNPTEGRNGGPGGRCNAVAVRGPYNHPTNPYYYLGGTANNVAQLSFPGQAFRPDQTGTQYRKVLIYLTPQLAPNYLRMDVYLQSGYNQPMTQALNGLMVGRPVPGTVKIGYAASTGGSNNYHEIRNLIVDPLPSSDIDLSIVKIASSPTVTAGGPISYTVTVRNNGPSNVTANTVPINDAVPAVVTGITWTCTAAGGATCGAGSGSGNSISTSATLPLNSSATYTITGTVNPAAVPGTQITNTAAITIPVGITDYNSNNNTSSITVSVTAAPISISGMVYSDNGAGGGVAQNGLRDGTETSTAQTMYAKLFRAGALTTALQVYPIIAAGTYVFNNVTSYDDYTIIISNINDTNYNPAPPNNNWVYTGPATYTLNVYDVGSNLTNQDFGLWNGARVGGKVIKDDGLNGALGNANDGVLNAAETGISGVTVRLANNTGGTTYDTTTTDSGGNFALFVPAAIGSGVTLRVYEVANPANYLSVSYNAGNTAGAYTIGGEYLSFTYTQYTDYTGVIFGDVPNNTFTPATNSATTTAPATVYHAHSITPGSGGSVTFAVNSQTQAWTKAYYRDTNCSGTFDGGDTLIAGAITASAGVPICILLQETVPAGAPGVTDDAVTRATFTFTNSVGPVVGTYDVTDSTTVIGAPGVGNKPLYLYSGPTYTLSRSKPPVGSPLVRINRGASQTWTEIPILQLPVTISNTLSPSVPVQLTMVTDRNATYTYTVDLYCSSAPATFLTANGTTPGQTALTLYTLNLPFTGPIPSITCSPPNFWVLRIAHTGGASATRWIDVYPANGGNYSNVSLPSQNVINVDSITAYSAAYPSTSTPPSGRYSGGSTVYVRTVVSDPFGSYDIVTAPTVTIRDPANNFMISSSMPLVNNSGAATKTFEYPYTIPVSGPTGTWNITVISAEGTEGMVSHAAIGNFRVMLMPSITAVKAVSTFSDPYNNTTNPKSIPGAVMLYTITVINSGLGPVDADSMAVTDPVPANTSMCVSALCSSPPVAFTCSVAPAACGLTYNYATAVTYSNRVGGVGPYDYTPVPDAGGYDAAVTGFQVRPSGAFSGVGGPPYSQLTIQFRVKVR